ncbi:hypothetical protein [Flavobacterium turcicum]|uniref:Uncharacterized protein n=1 Tax=Flavobacterium turcicum TaxID=2764718 RepID=A0ABR7JGC2_9FLAO|nr:hypothetical protein [Flavobacterium turcicum]MBC5863536.1 hypothetical protein [Flavobacterium turcicum]NHL02514.1 hypothetical protein [Flavobacterium turcicum]
MSGACAGIVCFQEYFCGFENGCKLSKIIDITFFLLVFEAEIMQGFEAVSVHSKIF